MNGDSVETVVQGGDNLARIALGGSGRWLAVRPRRLIGRLAAACSEGDSGQRGG